MRNTKIIALAAFLTLTLGAWQATGRADTITFLGTATGSSGTGFGNIASVLSLQNSPSEWGGVSWDGSADVLLNGSHEKSGTQTWTVTGLAGQGITSTDTLGLIFQVNESGGNPKTLLLRNFDVVFYDDGGNELFTKEFLWSGWDDSSPGLPTKETDGIRLEGTGTGSSGWLFDLKLSNEEQSLFFGTPTNRVGMQVVQAMTISESDNGPDNFYFANLGPRPHPQPTLPSPSTVAGLLSMGATILLSLGWRRWKQARAPH